MTLSFFLAASLAVLITGISKSGFAGGLGILAVPILTLFVSPQEAVVIMMPILVVIDCANIWRYRNDWSRRVVAVLMPGALVGIAIGAFSFEALNTDLLRLAVGVMALIFVAQAFLRPLSAAETRKPAILPIFGMSLFSGYASFVAHAGGPPIKGVLLRQTPEKSEFVGTNGVFFFTVNMIKAVIYGAMGQYSVESLQISAMMVPVLILGVVLGFQLHRIIRQEVFLRLSYGLLALAGLRLIYDGLTALV